MRTTVSRRSFFGTAVAAGSALVGATAFAKAAPVTLPEPIAVEDLPTPALLIDLDAFEANLTTMANFMRGKGKGLRPHAKTHKCPIIAKQQIALGALGICCAKLSEAEVMADAGIADILVTSPVTTKDKIDRAIALAKRCDGFQIVVDNAAVARDFATAAKAADVTLRVVIDIDTGSNRTGIQPGAPALALLEEIKRMPSLQFDGLQAYSGHVMHIEGFEKRKAASINSLAAALETKAMMEKAGHEVGVFTGGGTGSSTTSIAISTA